MAIGLILAAAVAQASPGPAAVSPCTANVSTATSGQAGGQSTSSYSLACFAASNPTTALDMVGLLPGFSFDKGDSVRGFGGAAGNVLIDGARPASKGDPLDEIIKRIPASQVLRIDVIRGGGPGIDMQGKTVIANIVRRQDGGFKLVAQSGWTFNEDGRVAPGLRLEASRRAGDLAVEGALLIGAGVDDGVGDGPRVLRNAGGIVDSGREIGRGDAVTYKLTGAAERPLAGGRLKLDGTISINPYNATMVDNFTGLNGRQVEHDHQDQNTYEIGLRYERPLTARITSETFLLQQFGLNNFDERLVGPTVDELFVLDKTTRESIARSTLKYSASDTLSFEAGGEGAYNWLRSRTIFAESGVPIALPAANVQVTEKRGEPFATATWRARPTLTLESGIRAEASSIASTGDVTTSRTLFYPKPRAVLSWSPDAADQVRVRVEREIGQLNFDNFTVSAATLGGGSVHGGNPNLNPQQAWVVEVAYDRRFWGPPR